MPTLLGKTHSGNALPLLPHRQCTTPPPVSGSELSTTLSTIYANHPLRSVRILPLAPWLAMWGQNSASFVVAIATSLGVHSSQCMADEGSCVGKVWNGREAKPELKMFRKRCFRRTLQCPTCPAICDQLNGSVRIYACTCGRLYGWRFGLGRLWPSPYAAAPPGLGCGEVLCTGLEPTHGQPRPRHGRRASGPRIARFRQSASFRYGPDAAKEGGSHGRAQPRFKRLADRGCPAPTKPRATVRRASSWANR
jgi:hypothetical protein